MPHRPNKRAGRGLPLILLQVLLCGAAFAVEPQPDSAGADADEANSGPVETIVVTASRLLMPESSLTSSVNVITSDEIESRNTSSATDLLRQLPGVNVTQQGGRGGVSSVIVRGGESNFTTVMIDGVKVNDPTNSRGGAYDFGNLDLFGINRLEIVRGPLTSLYGSDALAGVIQVLTGSTEPGGEILLQAGTDGYAYAAASRASRIDEIAISAGLNAIEDDSDVEGATYEAWGASGGIEWDYQQDASLSMRFRYRSAESTSFPEDSGGPEYAVIRETEERDSDEVHVRLAWEQAFHNGWNLSATVRHFDHDEQTVSPGITPGVLNGVPPFTEDAKFDRDQLTITLGRTLSDRTRFIAGGEWQNEDGSSKGVLDFGFPVPTDFELDRDTNSLFSELSVDLGPLALQGSIRRDVVDDIDGETTAHLGAKYRFDDGQTELSTNWGQGFKAPSFFALAHPLIGNRDLESETADSYDITLERRWGEDAKISLAVYRNEYEGLIDLDPAIFQLVNRANVVTEGVEMELAWPVSDRLQLQGHLSYATNDTKDSNAELRGRPKWRGGLILDWVINSKWRLVTSALALDEFTESSIPTGSILLDGYERVDVAASWRYSNKLTWQFAVDNLLDADYQEAVGFPVPGIRLRVGARFRF